MDYLTTFALEHLKQSTLTLVLDLSILKEIIPAVLRNPGISPVLGEGIRGVVLDAPVFGGMHNRGLLMVA